MLEETDETPAFGEGPPPAGVKGCCISIAAGETPFGVNTVCVCGVLACEADRAGGGGIVADEIGTEPAAGLALACCN